MLFCCNLIVIFEPVYYPGPEVQERAQSARTVQAGWRGHQARTRDPEVKNDQLLTWSEVSKWDRMSGLLLCTKVDTVPAIH